MQEAHFYTEALREGLRQNTIVVLEARACGGGCVHRAHRLFTSKGAFFIKWNTEAALGEFESEAEALRLLRETGKAPTPEVYAVGACHKRAYLIMEYLDSAPRKPDAWRRLGEQLARMHKKTHIAYGLHKDNYIARLPQANPWTISGVEFYREYRLLPQIQRGLQKGLLRSADEKRFEALFAQLPELWGENQPPALLHGDLWHGNIHIGPDGYFFFIDPALYYGHRETDWAMITLFGGFPYEFEQAYNAIYPLDKKWKDRNPLFQLYPLLIHLNLFGASYLSPIRGALKALFQ